MFNIYTDGACKKNGKAGAKGGWAYAIYDEEGNLMLSHSAHEESTTNQRMEIMAILQACKMAQILNAGSEIYACDIHSDSAYCINAVKLMVGKQQIAKRLRIKIFGNSLFHFSKILVSILLK